MGILQEVIVFLSAAVISVPVFKRLGLGSILGYLAAGLIIGPYALKLIDDPEDVLHFAEFGVVFFLFLVGLELKPMRLWALRTPIFGYGSLQFFVTATLLTAIIYLLGIELKMATVIGVSLALSSTAFALQMMVEKKTT